MLATEFRVALDGRCEPHFQAGFCSGAQVGSTPEVQNRQQPHILTLAFKQKQRHGILETVVQH